MKVGKLNQVPHNSRRSSTIVFGSTILEMLLFLALQTELRSQTHEAKHFCQSQSLQLHLWSWSYKKIAHLKIAQIPVYKTKTCFNFKFKPLPLSKILLTCLSRVNFTIGTKLCAFITTGKSQIKRSRSRTLKNCISGAISVKNESFIARAISFSTASATLLQTHFLQIISDVDFLCGLLKIDLVVYGIIKYLLCIEINYNRNF